MKLRIPGRRYCTLRSRGRNPGAPNAPVLRVWEEAESTESIFPIIYRGT